MSGRYCSPYALLMVGLLALGCGPSTWTPRQAVLAQVSTVLLVADWVQTHDITYHCMELNPIIGRCGERVPVDVYFPLVIVGHLVAGHLLGEWAEPMFAAVAGAQGATVWRNAQLDNR